jgi:N-methylhydantoinase A
MRGGQEPTVTDADMVLGYLNPDYFLGGEMKASIEKAEVALKKIAHQIGLSTLETADGIFRIVNNNMLGGMRLVTIGKGHDPRDYTLIVFGGAGPIHVPAFASELEISRIVIPRDASTFSALGMVVSDIRFDFVKNINRNSGDMPFNELLDGYEELKKRGTSYLEASLIDPENRYFRLQADMKFPGEYSEFLVEFSDEIGSMKEVVQVFVEHHRKLYDYVEEAPPEIMNIRLSAFGNTKKPKLAVAELSHENCEGAIKIERNAYFHELGKSILTPVYNGQKILPGNRLSGPAIIELPTTTIVIRPEQACFMDELSNFIINS